MLTRPPLAKQALTLAEIVTDAVLDGAFAWLCQQRRDWPPDADVWRFRQHWPEENARLRILLDRLAVHIADRQVLNLIGQYLQRGAERGGLYWDHRQGIALGSPLSPLLFGPGGLRVAAQTRANGVAWVHQLSEQEPGEHGSARLGAYVRRWRQWVRAGLPPTLAALCDWRAIGTLLLACDVQRYRCCL